jgi:phenylalanine-4-hydroxylase
MMERLGQLGVAAIARGEGERMARIYWYSVEFGLARENGEIKIFGAGLASSFGEFGKALSGDGVERRDFSIEEAASTPYEDNHMQPLYFINDGVEALAQAVDALED